MRTNILILPFAFLLFFLPACKKDSNKPSITGKWNIVTDSTYAGVGAGNHPVAYAGQPGDYFNFQANGVVYTKEGAVLDTLTYKLISNTQIVISQFGITLNGVPETSNITEDTDNYLVIKAPGIITPGGIFGRKVTLSR
jgi:hypothetical protein